MVLSFLLHAPAFSVSPMWMLPVLILAWPLIAPAPKPKATVKRIVGALLLAVALSCAVAVYAEGEDDATTDVLMRAPKCGSRIIFEIFGICL